MSISIDAKLRQLLKLRTITYFIPGRPGVDGWAEELHKAAEFLHLAKKKFEDKGYQVQTVRIATRLLEGKAAGTAGVAASTATVLELLAAGVSIGFLSAGATSSTKALENGTILDLIKATQFTSCSFAWQPDMGLAEAKQLAKLVLDISEATKGLGNFRFGVAFNCPAETPYFPVARPAERAGFAIGLENSGLLYAALDRAAKTGGGGLEAAYTQVNTLLGAALKPIEDLALQLEKEAREAYLGLDASIAPALERPSIPEAYERLGLGRFGGPGTLAITERLTAAIKALPLRRACGYSGLMLPVAEDTGLAEAAGEGRLSVGGLLHLSSVCGCGLDTVPVPGVGPNMNAEERAALELKIAGVLLDVAALAFRLNKPLSCRLLPVPGAAAGDPANLDSPYLVPCKVMEL